MVKDCVQIDLHEGETMIIPTGWIHSVWTPSDSLVIGGNFIHGYDIPGQLRVYNLEIETGVQQKYRFPWFESLCWYAAKHYGRVMKSGY
jgi:F-box/leucine-rich repeat protein 10/11